jgi:molybdopterin converting factor small subunit
LQLKSSMSVKVELFYPRLKELTGDPAALGLEGRTVGECLNDLVRRFPGARELLFDERGALLRQVFVYINAESAYKAALEAPVKDGDRLIIAALVIGG